MENQWRVTEYIEAIQFELYISKLEVVGVKRFDSMIVRIKLIWAVSKSLEKELIKRIKMSFINFKLRHTLSSQTNISGGDSLYVLTPTLNTDFKLIMFKISLVRLWDIIYKNLRSTLLWAACIIGNLNRTRVSRRTWVCQRYYICVLY